jgi:hypothetical protein
MRGAQPIEQTARLNDLLRDLEHAGRIVRENENVHLTATEVVTVNLTLGLERCLKLVFQSHELVEIVHVRCVELKHNLGFHSDSLTGVAGIGTQDPLPFPLPFRRQRPDPPLAEVQVAEEERLLQLREVKQVGELGDPGSGDAQLPCRPTAGVVPVARSRGALFDHRLPEGH